MAAIWTYEVDDTSLESIKIKNKFRDGVLVIKQLLPKAGYVLYNINDLPKETEGYDEKEEEKEISYFRQASLPPFADHSVYQAKLFEEGMKIIGEENDQ